MKCEACKYNEPEQSDDIDAEEVSWRDLFYKTDIVITVNKQQGSWDVERLEQKRVYICPRCGTLKVKL